MDKGYAEVDFRHGRSLQRQQSIRRQAVSGSEERDTVERYFMFRQYVGRFPSMPPPATVLSSLKVTGLRGFSHRPVE